MVTVRQDDRRDPLARFLRDVNDPAQMTLVVRARVDDHSGSRAWLGHQPGVGAVQGHQAGVRGENAAGPVRARPVDLAPDSRLICLGHSGYSRSPGTFSQVAPSETITSGSSGRTSRGAASTAAASGYSASSASVIAVGSHSWIWPARPASSASRGEIHWTAAASPPTSLVR